MEDQEGDEEFWTQEFFAEEAEEEDSEFEESESESEQEGDHIPDSDFSGTVHLFAPPCLPPCLPVPIFVYLYQAAVSVQAGRNHTIRGEGECTIAKSRGGGQVTVSAK